MKKITHIVFDHDGTLVDTAKMKARLFPGITDLLEKLHKNQIKMYVWTARTKRSAFDILHSLKVDTYFEDICGGNDAPGKPTPDGIFYLIPDVNPENVIVIGDSLGDIIGGTKFGAHCIGAMWGHGDASAAEAYASYGAKTSFIAVDECSKYIEKLI